MGDRAEPSPSIERSPPTSSKLVIHPAIEDARLAAIRAVANEARRPLILCNASDSGEVKEAMADADAFFGKLTPELLARAPRLRWIQAPTASLEHYLFPELIEHPAVLTNMRGLYSDVIADHVMGMVVALARHFPRYWANQQEGRWEPVGGEEARVGFDVGPGVTNAIDRAHPHLGDLTLGIVGLGEIGREVARRARAFSMRIVALDPVAREAEGVETISPPSTLNQFLPACDFVVVCAPHTPATVRMFRKEQFARMKLGAYFINVGRGALVDTPDLIAALQQGLIAGAGLDVVDPEPVPPDHPLWRLPNVLITPHVAGYSPRIAARHAGVLFDNVRRFLLGEPLRNVVRKVEWY